MFDCRSAASFPFLYSLFLNKEYVFTQTLLREDETIHILEKVFTKTPKNQLFFSNKILQ